jgi:DNA-binding transcriptional MerR regulator
MFTVGELSRLTGVTVRAQHHYDEIGLVVPSGRSDAGYRLYHQDDVRRLQQVLVLRELGVPLEAIAQALEGTRDEVLRAQRQALVDRRAKLDTMLTAVDAALKKGTNMTSDDVQSMFAGFDATAYEGEARQRWGQTEAYAESAHRTKSYGKAEWEQIRAEAEGIYARLAAHLRAGAAVESAAVQLIVAEHRAHLDRWFYTCPKALHKALGEMYVADQRFTVNLDADRPGLARYLRDAIAAS